LLGFVTGSTLYHTLYTYRASAGVGPFDPSIAQNYIGDPNFAAVVIQEFPNLWLDNTVQLMLQENNVSRTYFFPGGPSTVSPYPGVISGNWSTDVIVVHQVLSLQVEYDVNPPTGLLTVDDCKLWATNDSAVELCLANFQHRIIAGTGPSMVLANW